MTEKEILEFCEKHKVAICWKYDGIAQRVVVRMQKGDLRTERAFPFDMACSIAFGLIGKIALREMLRELEDAAGGKEAKEDGG